jgi:Protein of unknown function (DUF3102)
MPPITLKSLAAKANRAHRQTEQALRTALKHAVAAGKALAQAKQRLAHGKWLLWLKRNCPDIGERTAQRYMRVARYYGVSGLSSSFVRAVSLPG